MDSTLDSSGEFKRFDDEVSFSSSQFSKNFSFQSIETVRRLPYPSLPNLEVVWTASNNACISVYLVDKKSSYFYIFYNRKMKTYKNPL